MVERASAAALRPLTSLADLRTRLEDLPAPDAAAIAAAHERERILTKPSGSLGRLEAIAPWLAGWQGRHPPGAARLATFVFAGNHGIATQGVSAYPAEVTAQMVANFAAGGAAINQLAEAAGSTLVVRAIRLDEPTADFTQAPAMAEAELLEAFNEGFCVDLDGLDLIAMGEMGIGNTTVAAALSAALHGGPAAGWCGRGTGLDEAGLRRKAEVIEAGLARHAAVLGDPLEVLRHLGGREIAAMSGLVLKARLARVPLLLDGYVASAAAAVLARMAKGALDHCLAAHVSAEPGHRRLLARLGLVPLLDLEMRLGEASGAALAMLLVRAALACHTGMASFADAGVSDRPA